MHSRSIFLFHRALRISDNIGLLRALQGSEEVFPVMIFDPQQIQPHRYRSSLGLLFFLKSLQELDQEMRMQNRHVIKTYGDPLQLLQFLLDELSFDAIYLNRDYTPFARERERKILTFGKKHTIPVYIVPDYLLNEPEEIQTKTGGYYSVFTPYYRTAQNLVIPKPLEFDPTLFRRFTTHISQHEIMLNEISELTIAPNPKMRMQGGRKEALKTLADLTPFKDYATARDFPWTNGTTLLSAHLKFGTVSIREVYWAINRQLGHDHPLLRQLYWRDFFTHIAFHFPRVFGQSFREKYNYIEWNQDTDLFDLWKQGKTGFPIVDAGMRELNTTGFMHNRVRMIVASFLTKDLHISWKWGEQYFAQQLVDYDPAVNNGNWQWAASTGCDAQPYFRIFNPWSQQKRFDPAAAYIKKWLPELRPYPASVLHKLYETRPLDLPAESYPPPIVNHKNERELTLQMFKSVGQSKMSM